MCNWRVIVRVMKHDVLRSVAHNMAASLASGIGLMIGQYELDVFADARNSPDGSITVDFLNGTIRHGKASIKLTGAVQKYCTALPGLCENQHVSVSDFSSFLASYTAMPTKTLFVVTVTDREGRTSRTEYGDHDGQKLKFIDGEGRLRPKPVLRSKR